MAGEGPGSRAPEGEAEPRESKQSIRMTADRLLVQPHREEGERRSRSGIVIPANASVGRRLMWGRVVAVGPTVRNIERGDQVLFSQDDCFEVDLHGDDYIIVRERDVHAVASEREEGQTGLYL